MEKLESYIKSVIEYGELLESRKNWIFGAADFALSSGMISQEDFERIAAKFDLC